MGDFTDQKDGKSEVFSGICRQLLDFLSKGQKNTAGGGGVQPPPPPQKIGLIIDCQSIDEVCEYQRPHFSTELNSQNRIKFIRVYKNILFGKSKPWQ